MAGDLNMPVRRERRVRFNLRLARPLTRAVATVLLAQGAGLGLPAVTAVASPGPSHACTGGIFMDTARSGTVDPGSPRTARRLRRVEIDLGRLFPGGLSPAAGRAAASITLNLFPDVCVTAERDKATDLADGKVEWIGHAKGAAADKAILVVDGAVMVGTVSIGGRTFQIRYLGDGVHAVIAVDQSAFPRD
jgi:hypothetical protein